MTRSNHARTTSGTACRNRRRRKGGVYPWFRPWCRANRAVDASIRLIDATLRTVVRSERCAYHHPVRTWRNLQEAAACLQEASKRLVWAAEALAETNECIDGQPGNGVMQNVLVRTTERWLEVAAWLQQAIDDVFALQDEVLLGLETGLLVPERPAESRPRIRLAPRPVPIRAFLLLRQPRVIERITPLLRRRRRIPRPAAVRVPRRNLLGRAPPLFSISVL